MQLIWLASNVLVYQWSLVRSQLTVSGYAHSSIVPDILSFSFCIGGQPSAFASWWDQLQTMYSRYLKAHCSCISYSSSIVWRVLAIAHFSGQ